MVPDDSPRSLVRELEEPLKSSVNQSQSATETPAPLYHETAYRLGVSSYDRVSSLLIATLVLVGFFVVGLVIVFLASRVFPHYEPAAVEFVEIASRSADAAMGLSRDLEPPGIEDAPDLQEPKLMETLSAVAEMSSRVARIDNEALDGENVATKGTGRGDSRRAGTGSDGVEERVPREERWKIRYNVSNVNVYARQLDGLGIELGAFGGGENIVRYAANLAGSQPTVRSGPSKEERRLFMFRPGGPLAGLNRTLLEKAGVRMAGKTSVQFYPQRVEARLLQLERAHMEKETGGYDVNQIRRTIFQIADNGGNFSFEVLDQRRF